MPADRLFVNAKLGDGTGRDMLVRDGRIVAIEAAGARSAWGAASRSATPMSSATFPPMR
jgi:hypothetical protein